MSMLYLPRGVSRELYEERLEREASARESGVFVRDDRCREFDPLLFNVEPYLSMVFCKEPAPLEAVACGARPGRYNIVRVAPGQPVTFIPVVDDDGGYLEPTARIFDRLAAMDWWDGRVKRDRDEQMQRLRDAQAKREVTERRRMDEEVYERWLAVSRTQVSMNRDTPWAQNAAGYKRTRDEAKRQGKAA